MRFEQRAFDVFNQQFEEALSEHKYNYRETFEAVNESFRDKIGFLIYSSYESFKNARSRAHKKKLCKKHKASN